MPCPATPPTSHAEPRSAVLHEGLEWDKRPPGDKARDLERSNGDDRFLMRIPTILDGESASCSPCRCHRMTGRKPGPLDVDRPWLRIECEVDEFCSRAHTQGHVIRRAGPVFTSDLESSTSLDDARTGSGSWLRRQRHDTHHMVFLPPTQPSATRDLARHVLIRRGPPVDYEWPPCTHRAGQRPPPILECSRPVSTH